MITRIAPTPSGFLHQGNFYNFLLNWLWARANGGKVLLRIDDADAERKRQEYVDDIFQSLEKLGLNWDIGPSGPKDFEKNWSQLHRRYNYDSMLDQLAGTGKVYACCCTRTKLSGDDNQCSCREKNLSLGSEKTAWKIHVTNEIPVIIKEGEGYSLEMQDFIIRKKDQWAAYSVTSLSDDRHFGVTHIARGKDLLESTARQLYLDSMLEYPSFHKVIFRHHELLLDPNNEKLSKSAGTNSQPLLTLKKPDLILKDFSKWMGWDVNQYGSLSDMITHPSMKLQ